MREADIAEWIRLANHDIDTVDILINEKGHADIIIYHIHQAVEKLLKALIIKSEKELEKIHYLDRLLADLISDYPVLEKIKTDILEINLYLPKLRYPSGDTLRFEESELIYKKFNNIKEVLFSLLNIK